LKTLPLVNKKTSSRPQSPLLTYTSETGESILIPITPATSKQVRALFEEVLQGDLNPAVALRLEKICKTTDKAIADLQIQHTTSNILLKAVNERKARKGQKNQAWGYARIMNIQFLFDKQQEADEKEYEATKKAFNRLGPFLFNEVAGKAEPCRRAKPKPKSEPKPKPKPVALLVQKVLGTANLFATPRKTPAKLTVAMNKSPRKRGRPPKNPVAVAIAPVLLETGSVLTRIGRKVKVPVLYKGK
jgi:hypothetical protein